MKTFTFILTFLMIGIMAVAQDAVVIIDFEPAEETEGMEGVSYNNWTEDLDSDPVTVENPLVAGINGSANVVYYKAHTFTHPDWGDFGGFFCIRNIDPTLWADYNYLTFKFLIMQDTIETGDGISITMKYETSASSGDPADIADGIEVFTSTYTSGGEDIWEEVFIEIPEEVKAHDFKDFCVITSNVSENDNDLPMFYDDFRFTLWDDPTVTGIEELESQNGFSVYMVENTMNLRMDKAAFVQDVQVFDIKGSMLSHQVLNSNEKNFSIPVDIEAGVYMLRVRCDNDILARKFVKL